MLNRLPLIDTTFTNQNMVLGSTKTIDFKVSDLDGDILYTHLYVYPSFVSLTALATNSYRITISPPLTGFSLVGSHTCEVHTHDSGLTY